MNETALYREAYNAHEWAEDRALTALRVSLEGESLDALACLADPSWNWETRSFLSTAIVDAASEVLDAKLEAAIA